MAQDRAGLGGVVKKNNLLTYWVLKRREELLEERTGLLSACAMVFNCAMYSVCYGYVWVREEKTLKECKIH